MSYQTDSRLTLSAVSQYLLYKLYIPYIALCAVSVFLLGVYVSKNFPVPAHLVELPEKYWLAYLVLGILLPLTTFREKAIKGLYAIACAGLVIGFFAAAFSA